MTAPGAMQVGDIFLRVTRAFGDEVGAQIVLADVIRWINDAMRDIALDNDLIQATNTGDLIAGQQQYTLPTDIIQLYFVTVNGYTLQALSNQQAADLIGSPEESTQQSSTITNFWVWNNVLNLWPIPQTGMTGGMVIKYTRYPTPVTGQTDIPELPAIYHNRLVEYCLARAYEQDDDPNNAQAQQGKFEGKVANTKPNNDWDPQDYYPSITSLTSDNVDYGYWG